MPERRAVQAIRQPGSITSTHPANPRVLRGLARLNGHRADGMNAFGNPDRYEVSFPDDRAIGRLFALDDSGRWIDAGEARGSVQLPSRRFLRFENGPLPLTSSDLALLEPLT
ncbi:MAG: hypothetical protein M3439_05090, partial [Chloroflexota bacterium]|nr:hypothetical protein [Chloroflexota bacterium]